MKIEKMTYSLKEILNAINVIEKFSITTKRKIDHYPKLAELSKLFDEVLCPINKALFDPEYSCCFYRYKEGLRLYKELTKSDLDRRLKFVLIDTHRVLTSIIADGDAGDVNMID